MNIFFDYQAFEQPYGGISRYFCELITGVNNEAQHHAHLSLLWSNNVHLREYGIPVRSYPFIKRHRLFNKTNRLYNRLDATVNKYDIYHTTYFNDFLVPYIGSSPCVTTFYDMTYERLSHRVAELSNDKWIIPQKRKIAQRASHLIAISESTKQDMVEFLGVPPEKITVTYLSSPFVQNHESLTDKTTDPPYLLYVGKRYEYKNFIPFLKAIAHVLIRHQVVLICAGGGDLTSQEKSIIQELALDKLVKYKEINDTILQDLYKRAISFVFPSLYEGFGIPVLEAFACNCPCVVSNTSSLPEVAGEAAIYMDPTDSGSMAHATEKSILDNDLRNKLIKCGRQQLSRFSWQRTVDDTLDVYKKLI